MAGAEYQELADEYKIDWYMVRAICKNRQWKHVGLGEECKNYKYQPFYERKKTSVNQNAMIAF